MIAFYILITLAAFISVFFLCLEIYSRYVGHKEMKAFSKEFMPKAKHTLRIVR